MTERLSRSDHGATMAEYALMMSLVALVALLGVLAFGGSVAGLFNDSCADVATLTGQPCS